MKNFQKNQKGFSAIEGILILAIVGLIAGTGWYVWDSKQKTDKSLNNSSQTLLQNPEAVDTSDWQTYIGDPVKYPPLPAQDGDEVVYSFKYPKDWKFYPRGTVDPIANDGATTSFQQVVATGKNFHDGIAFSSAKTDMDAKSYYQKTVGDQSQFVGPVWESQKSFTTKNDYSAHTSMLRSDIGTTYHTDISNKKGVVSFDYGQTYQGQSDLMQSIFDSVTIP